MVGRTTDVQISVGARLESSVRSTTDSLNNQVRTLSREYTRSQTVIRRQSATIARLGRTTRNTNASMMAFRRTLIQLGGVAVFGAAIRSVARYDDAITGVRRTTGLAGRALDGLSVSLRQFSLESGISATNLGQIAIVAGQLGISSARDIEAFTRTFARLERATNLAGEEGALAFGRIALALRIPIVEVERLGDVFVSLGNRFPVTEAQLAPLVQIIANATVVFDLAADSIFGIATALGSADFSGQVISGALTRFIRQVRVANQEQLQFLANLTQSTPEAISELIRVAPGQFFRQFLGGINRSGLEVTDVFAQAGFGDNERDLRVIQSLLPNLDRLDAAARVSRDALRGNNALVTESDIAFESLGSRLGILGASFTEIGLQLVNQLSPVLDDMVSIFTRLAEQTDIVVRFFSVLPALLAFLPTFRASARLVGSVAATRAERSLRASSQVQTMAAGRTRFTGEVARTGITQSSARRLVRVDGRLRNQEGRLLALAAADQTAQFAVAATAATLVSSALTGLLNSIGGLIGGITTASGTLVLVTEGLLRTIGVLDQPTLQRQIEETRASLIALREAPLTPTSGLAPGGDLRRGGVFIEDVLDTDLVAAQARRDQEIEVLEARLAAQLAQLAERDFTRTVFNAQEDAAENAIAISQRLVEETLKDQEEADRLFRERIQRINERFTNRISVLSTYRNIAEHLDTVRRAFAFRFFGNEENAVALGAAGGIGGTFGNNFERDREGRLAAETRRQREALFAAGGIGGTFANFSEVTRQERLFQEARARVNQAFTNLGQGIAADIGQFANGLAGIGDTLTSVLRRIVQQVTQSALVDPLSGRITQAFSGAGIGFLFGSGTFADTASPAGAPIGAFPGFADGGVVGRGGLAVVGERGPEIVRLPTGAQVYENGFGPAGQATTINVIGSPNKAEIDLSVRTALAELVPALRQGLASDLSRNTRTRRANS